MSGQIQLELPCDSSAPRRMIEAMETLFAQHSLPASLVPAFAVALEEVLTNIVEYGFPDGVRQPISARLAVEAGEVHAEVSDAGIPFDPLAAPDPDTTLSIDERGIGGLGILLVKRLMDQVSYEHRDGRNLLRFRKTVLSLGG